MGAIERAVDGLFVNPRGPAPVDSGPTVLSERAPGSIAGKTAVVVGGNGGIGRAITGVLAADDVRVLSADLGQERDDAIGTAPVDVTDCSSVEALVRMVQERFGRIDLVVNASGTIAVGDVLATSVTDWRRVIDVNLVGAFTVIRQFGEALSRQPEVAGRRGQIVTLGSLAAYFGRPLVSSYGASKAGVNSLCKSTAEALGPRGVGCTVVFPGNVREGMWGRLPGEVARAEGRDAEAVAAERAYQPGEDIGDIVADVLATDGLALSGSGVTYLREVERL